MPTVERPIADVQGLAHPLVQGEQVGAAFRQVLLHTAIGEDGEAALDVEEPLARPGPRDLETIRGDRHPVPLDARLADEVEEDAEEALGGPAPEPLDLVVDHQVAEVEQAVGDDPLVGDPEIGDREGVVVRVAVFSTPACGPADPHVGREPRGGSLDHPLHHLPGAGVDLQVLTMLVGETDEGRGRVGRESSALEIRCKPSGVTQEQERPAGTARAARPQELEEDLGLETSAVGGGGEIVALAGAHGGQDLLAGNDPRSRWGGLGHEGRNEKERGQAAHSAGNDRRPTRDWSHPLASAAAC